MEKMTISRDGILVADLTRVLDINNRDNRVRINFPKEATAGDKYTIKDIMSKNISMFGRGETGSIKWFYLKKGSIEQWVFASVEFEKRGFVVQRDEKTDRYLKKLIALYFPHTEPTTAAGK